MVLLMCSRLDPVLLFAGTGSCCLALVCVIVVDGSSVVRVADGVVSIGVGECRLVLALVGLTCVGVSFEIRWLAAAWCGLVIELLM